MASIKLIKKSIVNENVEKTDDVLKISNETPTVVDCLVSGAEWKNPDFFI